MIDLLGDTELSFNQNHVSFVLSLGLELRTGTGTFLKSKAFWVMQHLSVTTQQQ